MNPKTSFPLLIALAGAIGVVILIALFVINPAPPPGATLQDILEFGRQHATIILLAGWMQGFGSLLNVVFALGLIHLAGAGRKLAGSNRPPIERCDSRH